jgi:hypothetical protein
VRHGRWLGGRRSLNDAVGGWASGERRATQPAGGTEEGTVTERDGEVRHGKSRGDGLNKLLREDLDTVATALSIYNILYSQRHARKLQEARLKILPAEDRPRPYRSIPGLDEEAPLPSVLVV